MTPFSIIFRRMKSAVSMYNAQVLASKRDYQSAFELLQQMFEAYGGAPSYAGPLLANVFLADLSEKLGRLDTAFSSCEIAIRQIDNGVDGDGIRYEGIDLEYIKYCCKWILSNTTKERNAPAFILAKSIDITYDDLKIEGVNPKIRRLFPVSAKDGAALDEFMRRNAGGNSMTSRI